MSDLKEECLNSLTVFNFLVFNICIDYIFVFFLVNITDIFMLLMIIFIITTYIIKYKSIPTYENINGIYEHIVQESIHYYIIYNKLISTIIVCKIKLFIYKYKYHLLNRMNA